MRQDIRFALRMFRRQPGIVVMTIAGLAVAIGISTAMFSLINSVIWRGNGIREPEKLFRIRVENLGMGPLADGNSAVSGNWSFVDYATLARTATAIDAAAGFSFQESSEFRASAASPAGESVRVMPVSGPYFRVLGGQTGLGRTLAPADDMPGAPKLVVLNHAFWKTVLDGDPSIVGRTVWLDDVPFTVAGVANRGFIGAVEAQPPAMWVTFGAWADVWSTQQRAWTDGTHAEIARLTRLPAPTALERDRLAALRTEISTALSRWNRPVDVLGRLRPGVSEAQAATEVTSIARGMAAERHGVGEVAPSVRLDVIGTPGQRMRAEPALMIAVSAIVLIIVLLVVLACSNVANLLLANAAGRRREIGTRLALGASRARIVRQLLTESLVLGAIGGAGGLVLSLWLAPVLARLLQFPNLLEVAPDLTVYLFVVGVTLASGVLAGLAPARYGRRGDVLSALQADRHGVGPAAAPRRLRSLLIGGQAAASVVLLVLAALLSRSLMRATTLDLGFNPDRLVSISVAFSRGYDNARVGTYWDAALDRVKQVPGVGGAALVSIPPFGGVTAPQRLSGQTPGSGSSTAQRNEVSAGYFDTIGMRIERGRAFTADEVKRSAAVAVISAGLARQFWGERDPIGSTLDAVWGPPDNRQGMLRKPAGARVIGVVTEAVTRLRGYGEPTIYLPMAPDMFSAARMVVATTGDPQLAARAIVEALRSLDPARQVRATLVRDGFARELELPQALTIGSLVLGGSALALAVIGLFGVTAFVVGQRRHEISVRMALGAGAGDVVRMLVRQSLRPVAIGTACGLVAALGVGQVIRGVLVGVTGHDPIAIAAAIGVLVGAAGAAAFIPARRAARVSPAEMLKQQ